MSVRHGLPEPAEQERLLATLLAERFPGMRVAPPDRCPRCDHPTHQHAADGCTAQFCHCPWRRSDDAHR